MHSIHHFALHQVYAKTEKGQNELVRPRFGLDSRQRRILMRIDGVRNLGVLTEFFPEQELEDILHSLVQQGFIVNLRESDQDGVPAQDNSEDMRILEKLGNSAASNAVKSCKEKCQVLTQDPARFSAAKELMLEVAVVHLGILGRDIMQRIERAGTPHSLLMLAGRWNMALCESKSANRYAPLYLEKLKLILFEE